jgi:hypothetical protein
MNETLIVAQTIFYATFSFAILLGTLILIVVAYYLVRIARHLSKVARNAEHLSDDVRERILEYIDEISRLPLVSLLFQKRESKHRERTRKGRS